MAQQPTWRGHRAPVEDPERPGVVSGQPSPRRSRWLVLAGALCVGIVVAGCAILTARLTRDEPTPLPDITAGTCLRSDELARGGTDLHDLDAVSCSRPHDAEVYAVRTAAAGEDLAMIGDHCLGEATERGVTATDLADQELEVRPLALTDAVLRPGDTVACFIRHQNGTRLRGAVFTSGSDR